MICMVGVNFGYVDITIWDNAEKAQCGLYVFGQAAFTQMALTYKKIAANLAYAAKLSQVGFGSPPKLSTARIIFDTVLPSPTLISNVIRDHFTKGPPAKSWSLEFHIAVALMRDVIARSRFQTVEHMQWLTSQIQVPLPPFTTSKDFIVPPIYRDKAGEVLELAIDKHDYSAIGWDWRSDKKATPRLSGEWLTADDVSPDKKNESVVLYVHGGAGYMGSTMTHRLLTSGIAKATGGRVCAINQRLAPQHPYPASLEDALASYLRLIDPENENRVDPKNVIIAGESHGGGLVMALLLLLRDCNLPFPAGAIGLSPWVDLTHSLPSILSNIATDYLPSGGFSHKHSHALEFQSLPQFEAGTLGPLGKAVRKDRSLSHEDLDRVQFYAPNQTLKMRYVSPIFDEQGLGGLPPLLIQVGTAERLRDESIYFAYKATNEYPGASLLPENTHFPPTKVNLEMYIDQPHVFQMILSTKQRAVALNRIGEFVRSLATSKGIQRNSGNDKNSKVSLNPNEFENLQICTVHPTGEVTKSMTDLPTQQIWNSWEQRLQKSSLRERLEEVQNTLRSQSQ